MSNSSKMADTVLQAQKQHNDETSTLLPKKKGPGSAAVRKLLESSSFASFLNVTEEERLEALNHPGVGQAAFLIRDAVFGYVENPAEGAYDPYTSPDSQRVNDISVVCRRICSFRPYRRFIYATVWVLILLTFLEPPNWCRYLIREGEVINDTAYILKEGRCEEFLSSVGPPAGGSNDTIVDYYPNTTPVILRGGQYHTFETICLAILWVYVCLCIGRDGLSLRRYTRAGPAQVIRYVQLIALSCLSMSLVYDIATGMDRKRLFAPYLRLILFVTADVDCMRELKTLIQMIPEVANVLFLLILFIVFYSWIGVVAFYGSDEGHQYFPNLIDAMFTLWIATTTANYPDLMMPAYNTNRLVTLYFVLYMLITFFFMMNVILASVVNAYDNELEHRKLEGQELTERKLSEAFDLLDSAKSGMVSKETIMALFVILNEDFPEIRNIPKDEARILFAILDKDGSNIIEKEEFMEFGNVLLLQFELIRPHKSFLETFFPTLYASTGYNVFANFIQSNLFEVVVDVILVLNAIVVLIQSYPMLLGEDVALNPHISDGSIDTIWEILEAVFTMIYVTEMAVKILVNGWHNFSQSNRNLFDLSLTLLAVVASIYVYYPNDFSDSRLIRFIVMSRVLRLSRLLVLLRPFQTIAYIAMDVFARARVVLLLLFCVSYFFAALGVQVFGGMISRDPKDPRSFLLLESEFAANEYWANNFNDMFSALNVLFNLLVVNNWTECQDGFEAVTQSRYNRLYFVAFHIIGVILVNNLVMAFIINAFIKQWDFRQEKLRTKIIHGEAVIIGRRALFDAKLVTGTATDLSGTYAAKIGRRELFDEQQQQRILKSMFTSSLGSSRSERVPEGNDESEENGEE